MSTFHQPAHHTPTALTSGTNDSSKISSSSAQTSAGVALTMSWQLLVVVVLPLLGGHLLDSRYHTSPIWMIVGMVIGLAGSIIVVRQTVQQLNEIMNRNTKESQ
jgi:F0F1-type ATP synthase assembly protein I